MNHSILHPAVSAAIKQHGLVVDVMECDPDFADTTAFNERYGFAPEQGANTILVASRKVEPVKYAVCVVLASTRLDVNKKVTKLLGVKRASFADSETTKRLTDMEIGGVTAVGIETYPVYIDDAVMKQSKVVMGGGNRTSKIVLDPQELLKYPPVEIIENLAIAIT